MPGDIQWFDDLDLLWGAITEDVGDIPRAAKAAAVGEAAAILRKHIEDDIYGVYTPKEGAWVRGSTYQRRHEMGKYIIPIDMPDGSVLVTTTYSPNTSVVHPDYHFYGFMEGGFLQLLESGNMGIWRGGFPRPAVSNAQDEFDHSSSVRYEINKALKNLENEMR